MIKRLLGWVRKGDRTGASPAPPPARKEPSDPSSESPSPPPPADAPGASLQDSLGGWIEDRSRWLREWPGSEDRGMDCEELVNSLQDRSGSVIRQPPVVARRLLLQARRQNTSYSKMAKSIEADPSLVHSLLRHANSVFYAGGAGGRPIASLPPALQRLGTTGIEIVVMSHLVEGTMCRPGGGLDSIATMVWAHMVRTAPLAREIAPRFGMDPDEGYALGLLHDVGKLVLFNRISDLRKKLRRPVRLPDGFVDAALRDLHAPLGARAVFEWGMGDEATLSIAHHHRNPPHEEPLPGSEVVFLAERLDLLEQRHANPDFRALWEAGSLTGDGETVRAWWEERTSGRSDPSAKDEASAA